MPELTWVIALIPAFPLLGFLLNVFVIRRERAAGLVASAAVVLSFISVLVAIYALQTQTQDLNRIDLVLWDWISVGTFRVPFGLLFDPLTAVMTLLVTGVGGIIHIYSIGYIHGDARPVRYFAYLNLFIVAMLLLVMGNNLLLLFMGWEGVGLCSFLLIGHWFDQRSVPPGIVPSEAAVKAFVVNRVGDAGMLLAMMAIFSRMGTLTFFSQNLNGQTLPGFLERAQDVASAQLDLGTFGTIGIVTAICMLLLLGVTGKSAQVPLFVWLPDAMAGPTPVSALIHAATMVTSGVYLIARNQALFEASPSAAGFVVAIGVLTALLAATAALAQWDIKRVLAYSTISQLGYMVAAVGMGAYVAGIFHLLTHGVFKALLFLGSGSIIHGTHDTQDMRKLGGLKDKMRTTWWTYMIGALALAGIFPFAGFWSKDEIIGRAWAIQNYTTAVALIAVSALTAFYMGRQVALIFYGRPRDREVEQHTHESGAIMRWPLIVLAVGAVIAGLMNLPPLPFELPGGHLLNEFLKPVLAEEAPAFNIPLALVTTALALGSFYGGWYLYAHTLANRIKVGKEDPGYHYLGDIWKGAEIAWGFDWFYEHAIIRPYRAIARFLSTVVDQQAIDGILVDGFAGGFGRIAQGIRGAQSGYVRTYALIFLVGVIVLVSYFAFR